MVRLSVPLVVRRRPPPDLRQPSALRREVHIVSLICTMASIILLAVSLGLRGWATGSGKRCQYTYGLLSVREEYNGVPEIRGRKCYEYGVVPNMLCMKFFTVTHYYNVAQQIIVSCILSISSLTIITSFVAMVVSAGFPREKLEFLRHYSVFNIVSCEQMCTYVACITFFFSYLDLDWHQPKYKKKKQMLSTPVYCNLIPLVMVM